MSFHIWAVIVRKEFGPRLAFVNPTIPARVQTRNRADRRLQSMTLGAAVLGIAAVGVFGYAAALTYTGKTNTVSAAGVQSFGGDQQPQQPISGVAGQARQDDQGNILNPFFGIQQVTPPTTSGHRQSHVSSGGS